jgi:ABC-type transport system involved in cytochrome c biogenesis ATPase subunit
MAARRTRVVVGRASERQVLDRLVTNVRGGQSAALVIRGEAGVGKTALLRHCARHASGFLHELCATMLTMAPRVAQAAPGLDQRRLP